MTKKQTCPTEDKEQHSSEFEIIKVTRTKSACPIGETIGNKNMDEGKIPVLSCEGACIRGEIARLATLSLHSRSFRF